MKDMITVLIPTSPIPSHPSTAILDETISNIRKYTDATIIIMFDGVHESLAHRTEDYDEYKRRVLHAVDLKTYGHCICSIYEHHIHQAEMTKRTLKDINTPLIMFCEHDTSPIGGIPFIDICEMLLSSTLNYIRFNIFHTILPEHEYLMLYRSAFPKPEIRYTHTIQWSQRPHIAKTKWYQSVLFDYFPDGAKTMIEDVMHSVVIRKYNELGFDTFGLAIYTPEGNQLRSYHSDGRGTDEKIITG